MAFSEEEDANFMEVTPVCGSDSIHLGQMTSFPNSQNADATAFLGYSKTIVLMILAGLLVCSTFVFCYQLTKQKVRLKEINFASQLRRLAAFFSDQSKSSYLITRPNLMRVCFLLFLNLTFNLITSNINQKTVTVDDSLLIDSLTKLFQTTKWPCWFADSDFDYFVNSAEGSDLWRVSNQTKRPDGSFCFLNRYFDDPSLIADFPVTKTFFLSKKVNTIFALSLFSPLAENKITFQMPILDFELLQVQYISKFLQPTTKHRLRHL